MAPPVQRLEWPARHHAPPLKRTIPHTRASQMAVPAGPWLTEAGSMWTCLATSSPQAKTRSTGSGDAFLWVAVHQTCRGVHHAWAGSVCSRQGGRQLDTRDSPSWLPLASLLAVSAFFVKLFASGILPSQSRPERFRPLLSPEFHASSVK